MQRFSLRGVLYVSSKAQIVRTLLVVGKLNSIKQQSSDEARILFGRSAFESNDEEGEYPCRANSETDSMSRFYHFHK